MPIYFEKSQRGEATVLSIYGTKDEVAQFADDLKAGVVLQDIQRNAGPRIHLSNLRSDSFDQVEVLVVDRDGMQSLQTSEKRKKLLILAIWALIVGAVLWMLYTK